MRQNLGHGGSGRIIGSLLLVVILIVAAALRIYDLDRTSLWYDEAVSWAQSRGTLPELLSSVAADNYPPLHNVILWLTMPIIGDSESALRLPSVILGILAVWLIYLAGRSLAGDASGGRYIGLLAAALLAVSPFHIWYSTEARMYALLAACGLAFLLSVLKVLDRPSIGWFALLSLSGAAFLYSHIYALLGFATVGLVCAIYALGDTLRAGRVSASPATIACLGMGVSALAFLPWLIILANRARSVAEAGFWIAYPDIQFLKSMAFSISGSLVFFWILAALALSRCLRALLVESVSSQNGETAGKAAIICLAYTAGPLVLAYLYSVLVQPILFDRYLIAAWPGLLLLASAGANQLIPRFGPAALLVAALMLTFPELRFTLLDKMRPDWRGIVQDYMANRSEGNRLMLYKGFAAPALEYYLRPPDAFVAAADIGDLKKQPPGPIEGDRWLLLVHSSPEEMKEALEAFSISESEPVAQRFGWGASGLKLLRSGPPN
ncbi:glycosyltransferase family 39 protein [Roseibium marinum]|uniref:Dolichyl-phosphate-mannose-protein mannosyltransferase n=1 Tax=Roseibium marinum TaxID=281252 RepID=A0A2S3ULZ8_9HYPH|nr:glycosyltransferase family 39 protein [Roseibium marinum]POF28747.1 dolichyl-phosphate-mannose-protein mannosyltransferase [Roseibium marinum]